MKHKITSEDFTNFFPEVELASEYDGRSHKKLSAVIAPRTNSLTYRVYFGKTVITETKLFDEAVNAYNTI